MYQADKCVHSHVNHLEWHDDCKIVLFTIQREISKG